MLQRRIYCFFIFFSLFLFPVSYFLEIPMTQASDSTAKSSVVIHYSLNGTIHGGTVEILEQIFAKALDEGAEAILIELDTPGGLLDSTEDIVKLFLNADVPILVYVSPSGSRAGSAGTFITLAAHIAAMAPGTYIGAAHPVTMFGGNEKEGEQQKIMKQKIESATSTFIETIAKQRGRNITWARKAVLESDSITEDQAVEKKVIDLMATNLRDLLDKIDGQKVMLKSGSHQLKTKDVQILTYRPDAKLRLLNLLASPTLIYLLILGIIAGIYLEVTHPGLIAPAILAGICLVLVLFATRTLPINAFGILLIIGALALFVAEIYVTSYGLLTVAAIISFFMGSLLLFDQSKTDLSVPLSYIFGSTAGLALVAIVVGILVVKSMGRAQTAGRDHLLGMTGKLIDPVSPQKQGRVFLNGEYWNVTSDEIIEQGEEIEVIVVKGLTLVVKLKNKGGIV